MNRRSLAGRLAALAAVTATLGGCAPDGGDDGAASPVSAPPGSTAQRTPGSGGTSARTPQGTLLVTDFGADTVTFVDPAGRGAAADLGSVRVGTAPYGIALGEDGTAWVATAEGVAAVDTRTRVRTALVPHRTDTGPVTTGEYRGGGMGIALSPTAAVSTSGSTSPAARAPWRSSTRNGGR